MWVLSFHGGSSGINNLVGYDEAWSTQSDVTPADPDIGELRGFQLAGTMLFVLQAHKSTSRVLIYGSTPGGYALQGALAVQRADSVFPKAPVVPGLVHPFDLAFGADGSCYISNQDTNVVIGLGTDGTPLPVAASLGSGPFLAGTAVASAIGQLPLSPASVPTPPLVPGPGGLGVLLQVDPAAGAGVSNSVRGVAVVGSTLLVADEVSNSVKAYTLPSGALLATIAGKGLSGPVHLLAGGATLYITSPGNASIYTVPLPVPGGALKPALFADATVPGVSGLAMDGSGNLHAALRTGGEVVRFTAGHTPASKPKVVLSGLTDEPEFLQYWA